ncbi:MAG: response regulator [Deltaproteobacteria bacterium]|nr:response regulator [Deltaproteobacteria bacterium]
MPKTILLADDSVTIQKVVAISFASEDATVVTVDNGDDAITKAREIHPDIVLADVVMPGKNGYEVCAAIKADPALSHIPVMLLTGTFEAFDEARAREVGSAGHIAKPFEAQSLISQVCSLIDASAGATPPPATVDSAEGPAVSDDAFDFFDDEESARDLTPAQNPVGDFDNLEFKSPASDFSFGDDDLSVSAPSLDQSVPVTPEVAPIAEAVEVTEATPVADATPLDVELEQPASAAPGGDDPDDSLAPDASRSGDQPFDFAVAEDVTDPLADLDPVPSVDPSDFAQATVIDPLGASGYDVSSSDLGPPMTDTRPDPLQVAATDADEAEMTRLAPETPPDPNSWPDPTPMAATPIPDDLTIVVAEDPMQAGLTPPPQAEPVAIAAEDDAPAVLAAELYSEPDPAEAPAAPAASPAEPANALLAAIEPELRQQLHDTLEKIAWESFGDLTDAIVRQSVERVEKIAWEVIPRMAETLIEEEIRRMKAESEDS